MFKRAVLILLACLAATTARAGAWPRAQGQGFVMSSFQLTTEGLNKQMYYYASTYVEYGLTEKFTLGADIGHSVSGNSKMVLFLNYPVALPDETHKLAVEIGFGRAAGNTVLRPGFSFGRSFESGLGAGWLSAHTLFEHHISHGRTDVKADLTIGLNLPNKTKMILQVQTGKQKGDRGFLRLAPSVAVPVLGHSHLEFGFTSSLRGKAQYGIKAGFWRDF